MPRLGWAAQFGSPLPIMPSQSELVRLRQIRGVVEADPGLGGLGEQSRRGPTMALKDTFKMDTMKKKAAEVVNSEPKPQAASPRKPLDMPYAGLISADVDPDPVEGGLNAGRHKGDLAFSGWHLMLSGLTGTGKGRRVFGPNILMWGKQPVIAMSTAGDLVRMTIAKRAQRGPVYLMDLSEEVTDDDLQGVDVTRVVSDPCALVNSDDEAMKMSDLLQATAKVGSASGGDGDGGDATWENQAARPLAAFIRAGGAVPHPQTGELVDGGGVRWVLEALDNPPMRDSEGVEVEDSTQEDFVTPSWGNAYIRAKSLLGSRHAAPLRAVAKMVDKQRDSVAMNLRNALKAWSLDAVSGDGTVEPFQPAMLEEPGATFYVVSPMDGSAASAACAVIEQSIQWWRRNVSRKLPTLGLFLDELANCAPIPNLAAHVSVLRQYNVRLIAGLQNTTQLKRQYKKTFEEMLTTFPAVLILPGTPEKELLEQATWFAGKAERVTSSVDEHGKTTRSTEITEKLTSSELLPRRKGQGRLLIGGQPGLLVDLPDIEATNLLD